MSGITRIRTSTLTLGTCLRFIGIGALILLILWYVHFQARNFLQGPLILLDDTGGVLHHEKTILLKGTTKNIVKITLNGKEIRTNEAGEFEHMLVLENGYSITTLTAEDRFGRTTSITREFVYSP